LAVIQHDQNPNAMIRLWDIGSDQPVEHASADCANAAGVALLPNAKEIICVSYPLAAQRLERNGMRWKGKPLNFDGKCTKPDSISPGALHSSMTSRARTCIVEQSGTGEWLPETVNESGTIDDILWSVKGGAFVEVLKSLDVLVASGDPERSRSRSRIKGSHARLTPGNKATEISVSDDGRRLVILSDSRDGQRGGRSTGVVRIYSLAEHKPLLSRLDGNVVVAPDGRWVATQGTDPLTETSDPPSNSTRIEVIALDEWLASTDARPVGREEATANEKLKFAPVRSIDVSPLGSKFTMLAARDAIILVSEQPPRTVVYDVTSGKEKFPPLDGEAQLLGSDGTLFLLQLSGEGGSTRVMRTRDGSEVARWAAPVWVSKHQQAIAVTQTGSPAGVLPGQQSSAPPFVQPQLVGPAPPGPQCGVRNVTVYAAAGDRLVPSGELNGLPDMSRIEVADDARSVTVNYRMPQAQGWTPTTTWRCKMSATGSTDASSCTELDPSDDSQQDSLRSPRGKFAVRRGERVEIVRRRDERRAEHVLRDFDNTNFNDDMTKFSADDQWVVVQPNKKKSSLDILKLNDKGDTAELAYVFDLTDGSESTTKADMIEKVGFEGDGRLLKITFGNNETMLFPLDPIPFAKWLVPRELTADEKCFYWRDDPHCPH
jgi:WD40-like Beta Propeller Repeat